MPSNDPRADVIGKALKDPAFNAELLKNPAAAVEKLTGVKVPPGVTLKVVSDSASVVHLVLPALPDRGALSDKDLSKVAGGAGSTKAAGCFNCSERNPNLCDIKLP